MSLSCQRVVKWPVPGVEPDLHIGRSADHRDKRDGQHQQFVALPRSPESRVHHHDLGPETGGRRAGRAFGPIGWFAVFRH